MQICQFIQMEIKPFFSRKCFYQPTWSFTEPHRRLRRWVFQAESLPARKQTPSSHSKKHMWESWQCWHKITTHRHMKSAWWKASQRVLLGRDLRRYCWRLVAREVQMGYSDAKDGGSDAGLALERLRRLYSRRWGVTTLPWWRHYVHERGSMEKRVAV